MTWWALVLAILAAADKWYRSRLPVVELAVVSPLPESASSIHRTFEEVMAASGPWPGLEV
jgi:hypothetical protein